MKLRKIITGILICLSFSSLSLDKTDIILTIANHPDIQYKDIAIAQFLLETGNNKSKLAKHNNIFGIKYNKNFANGKIGSYATYRSIDDCIDHFVFIQKYFQGKYKIVTKKDYIWFLKRKYAKSSSYTRRVTKIARKYKQFQ